ncbi:hypothetical protein COU59_00675 [Candidatus Pacearchaeota archaeon CG10_big_fil_rev_8_21_14_0_10_34_12]|nr:MAG: hypothetical protein COU59_00675 [Candidatus Pacearchaeota archaeon CG10_big_fil_rev_8_21_14_0_10_34_12]
MGIKVEFNPDLALREFETPGRLEEECLPELLSESTTHPFLKRGQRNYWLEGEIPLLQTGGDEQLSKPLASIIILEATHFIRGGEVWTRGYYKIVKKIEEGEPYFDGFNKIK